MVAFYTQYTQVVCEITTIPLHTTYIHMQDGGPTASFGRVQYGYLIAEKPVLLSEIPNLELLVYRTHGIDGACFCGPYAHL